MEANQGAPGAIRETTNYAAAGLWKGIVETWGRVRRLDWGLKNPANNLQLQGLTNVILVCASAATLAILYGAWGDLYALGIRFWSFDWLMATAWICGFSGVLSFVFVTIAYLKRTFPGCILSVFVTTDMVLAVCGIVGISITREFCEPPHSGAARKEFLGDLKDQFEGRNRLLFARCLLAMEVIKTAMLFFRAISNAILGASFSELYFRRPNTPQPMAQSSPV